MLQWWTDFMCRQHDFSTWNRAQVYMCVSFISCFSAPAIQFSLCTLFHSLVVLPAFTCWVLSCSLVLWLRLLSLFYHICCIWLALATLKKDRPSDLSYDDSLIQTFIQCHYVLERYLRFPNAKSAAVTIFLDSGCCVDDIKTEFHCACFPKIDCIFIFNESRCGEGGKKIKRNNVATYHVDIMWILYIFFLFFFFCRNVGFSFCSLYTFWTISNFIYIPCMHMWDVTKNFAVTIRSDPSILLCLFFLFWVEYFAIEFFLFFRFGSPSRFCRIFFSVIL